jgi:hypothetical protein
MSWSSYGPAVLAAGFTRDIPGGCGVLACSYPLPEDPGASTICIRWLLMIEAEQLLRVVVQDIIGDFLR